MSAASHSILPLCNGILVMSFAELTFYFGLQHILDVLGSTRPGGKRWWMLANDCKAEIQFRFIWRCVAPWRPRYERNSVTPATAVSPTPASWCSNKRPMYVNRMLADRLAEQLCDSAYNITCLFSEKRNHGRQRHHKVRIVRVTVTKRI